MFTIVNIMNLQEWHNKHDSYALSGETPILREEV